VATSHIHNLVYVKHRKKPLDCIFFPMLDVLTTPIVNTLGKNACPMVAITPEVVKAAFTKESDVFGNYGIRYLSPMINLDDRKLFARQMFRAWEPILGISEEESRRAIQEGFKAYDRVMSDLQTKSREVIDVLGRAYHHDPGMNHDIFERLQKLGYPILSQSTLPTDEDLLERLFGEEVRSGIVSSPLDISDAWKNTTSAASSQKIWAAKFAARHPNLVGVEIASFKCGHDAPIFGVIEGIFEYAGTPHFAFKDIDENKPTGSIKVRVETIHYFLTRYREEMQARRFDIEQRLVALEQELRSHQSPVTSPPSLCE
jgi:predicted nucleotide-binding protein (sugar kinase/HSP70/actin superfamily)